MKKEYFMCLWRVWCATDPDRADIEPIVYIAPQADPESVAREIFKDAKQDIPDATFFTRRKMKVVVVKIPTNSEITDRKEFSQAIRDCYINLFRSALAKSIPVQPKQKLPCA